MPPYPDEALPIQELTVAEFSQTCHDLIAEWQDDEDTPDERLLALFKFAIAGRVNVNGVLHRVNVRPAPVLNIESAQVKCRTYHTALYGWSLDLPYSSAWVMSPMLSSAHRMPPLDSLKVKVNHLQRDVDVDVHLIPNIFIGCLENGSLDTYLCAPRLYGPGCCPDFLSGDMEHLYNDVLQQCSIHTRMGNDMPTWQSWRSFVKHRKRSRTTEPDPKWTFDAANIPFISELLRTSLELVPEFQGAFFVHIRKNVRHLARHRQRGGNIGLFALAVDLNQDLLTIDHWRIQALHQISAQNLMVHWAEEGASNLLKCMLAEATDQDIKEMMKQAEKGCKYGPFMTPQDVTIRDIGAVGAQSGLCAVHFSTQENAPIAMQVTQPHSPSALFPNSMAHFFSSITSAITGWHLCGNEADPDDGFGEGFVTATATYMAAKAKYRLPEGIGEYEIILGIEARLWWRMKYFRGTALRLLVDILRLQPGDARVWPESLAMGILVVTLFNQLIGPSPIPRAIMNTIRRIAYQHSGEDLAEADEDVRYANGDVEAATAVRGMLFCADLVMNEIEPFTIRLPLGRVPGPTTVVVAYEQTSFSAIQQAFGLGSIATVLVERPPRRRMPRGHNHTTYIEHTTQIPFTRTISFGLANIKLPRTSQLSGPDVQGAVTQESYADMILEGGEVEVILNRIWRQLARDVVEKSPNSRSGDAYCSLTTQEVDSVRMEIFTHNVLPFTAAHVKVVTIGRWQNIFARTFPERGYKPAAGARGTTTTTYFQAWTALQNRLSPRMAGIVRSKVEKEFNRLLWFPTPTSNSMWSPVKMFYSMQHVPLPQAGTHGVEIAANPYIRGRGEVDDFRIREVFVAEE